MQGFYLALGITIVLPFAQWVTPTMPKPIAYAGMLGGIFIMLSEFLAPSMKPPFASVVLFLVGTLCIGGAIQLYVKRMPESPAPTVTATPPYPTPVAVPTHEATQTAQTPPAGLSNMTVLGNNKGSTFLKSDGANVSNENLVVKGFGTVFDIKGGSLRNKNVEADAPNTTPAAR